MKKWILITIIILGSYLLMACSDDGIPTEGTIISKEIVDDSFYFQVEYGIDNFEGTFTATIKVSEKVFNELNVGDTYVFTRPKPENYRNAN